MIHSPNGVVGRRTLSPPAQQGARKDPPHGRRWTSRDLPSGHTPTRPHPFTPPPLNQRCLIQWLQRRPQPAKVTYSNTHPPPGPPPPPPPPLGAAAGGAAAGGGAGAGGGRAWRNWRITVWEYEANCQKHSLTKKSAGDCRLGSASSGPGALGGQAPPRRGSSAAEGGPHGPRAHRFGV